MARSRVRAERIPADQLRSGAGEVEYAQVREMAIPSYTHPNPLIRWLFWERLDSAVTLAAPNAGSRILDFGAGSGVLLPTHHRHAARVVAVDVELRPARALAMKRGLATELVDGATFAAWADREEGSFDLVYALDVLEHIDGDELASTIVRLVRLLAAGGRLIVSGPTETRAYQLGRLLAGFRGDYHERNIFDIDAEIRRHARREAWVRVPRWPLPMAFLVGRYAHP